MEKKELKEACSKYTFKVRIKYYLAALFFAFVMSLFFSGNTPKRSYTPNQSFQQSNTEQEYVDKSNKKVDDLTQNRKKETKEAKKEVESLFKY